MKKSTIYFFSILVSGCITVPRIQKKDSSNNQFSQQLQNWFYVAHPQKIDTQTKVKSDTTFEYEYDSTSGQMGWGDSVFSLTNYPTFQAQLDSLSRNGLFFSPYFHTTITPDTSEALVSWRRNKGSIIGISNGVFTTWDSIKPSVVKKVIITIHDSVTKIVVDVSMIHALSAQLGAVRDSLTASTLLVATTKNSSLKRLIWALIASLAALVFLILFLKKSIL